MALAPRSRNSSFPASFLCLLLGIMLWNPVQSVVRGYMARHCGRKETIVPPYSWFCFPWFQLPWWVAVWIYQKEDSRNNQSISFKLHSVLSSVTKSRTIPLHHTWDASHPFVPRLHAVDAPWLLVTQWPSQLSGWPLCMAVPVFKELSCYLILTHSARGSEWCWQFGYAKEKL